MKSFIITMALTLTFVTGAWAKPVGIDPAQVQETGLTQQQAEQVLRMAIARSPYRHWLHSRNAYVESLDDKTKQAVPGFYMFRLAFDSPKALATAYAGPYLISQKTADVWDVSLSSACKNLHSPALTKLQAQVRKKTKTSVEDERSLRENFDCFDKSAPVP